MIRNWYLIDDDGFREIKRASGPVDFWTKFNAAQTDALWPPFTQLVVEAPAKRVRSALIALGEESAVGLEDVTARPELWSEGIYLANMHQLTLVSEPLTELEDRFVQADASEAIVQSLSAAGAFFGYDPSCDTLHLTMFQNGRPTFTWYDSAEPGPSYALVFNADGSCTHEDPRHFALRMLDMPRTSPLLDRYAFVESNLRSLGVDPVCPDLGELPIAHVLRARQDT
ncbi:MAG: hypothetical protein H0U74_12365 [Bradymonadaceae bacterium]|nr:hypothetical protein [Lujinxingiaceae bacterium]